ncbi:MAG: phosphoribosylformylglycinamidine synthase subunit PurS [bacterium]
MWEVHVYVTPKRGVVDPQGNTVKQALMALGYKNVDDVRIGKFITLKVDGKSEREAKDQVEEMCRKLLANPVIEDFTYDLVERKMR